MDARSDNIRNEHIKSPTRVMQTANKVHPCDENERGAHSQKNANVEHFTKTPAGILFGGHPADATLPCISRAHV